ncbi:iron export ABC transporter permease subunit FetB [Sulfurovum sp. TSL6]|uniref:ABC transporter permease n=1 Tax=Sulfurovum sp. TSL6 TaxID=2826995 RepID=UPI001CC5D531|nr:ABC transporter permease [Sulfurovum sp. TSL6]GIT99988.1 iron export ABC transporter permease subunit FetB [Sulfurovum sp. TSL6]
MNTSIYNISLLNLLWVMVPVAIVIVIYIRWTQDKMTLFYALFRMLIQLILIGYVLTYIFNVDSPYLVLLILSVMLIAASIIAMRPVEKRLNAFYLYAFIAIFIGSVFTLLMVVFGVLSLEPWYEPRYLIPLAGMIFANAMNAVSIAAERLESEIDSGNTYINARVISYKAALIPRINILFAVGLVSLPGMMTGQILSGVDPLIAVRYQIMVMLMILGSAGISVAIYLMFLKKRYA